MILDFRIHFQLIGEHDFVAVSALSRLYLVVNIVFADCMLNDRTFSFEERLTFFFRRITTKFNRD